MGTIHVVIALHPLDTSNVRIEQLSCTEYILMTKNQPSGTSFGNTCTTLLLLSTMAFSLPGFAKNGTSAWQFGSESGFCHISTTVQSNENRFYGFLSSINLWLYYSDQPDLTDNCDALEQHTISGIITTWGSERFRVGTHALLQSNSLLNEQIPAREFSPGCKTTQVYSIDYRVTNLLVSALLAKENIRLTAYLDKSGAMTSPVHTDGFEAAYEKLVSCIERLNE